MLVVPADIQNSSTVKKKKKKSGTLPVSRACFYRPQAFTKPLNQPLQTKQDKWARISRSVLTWGHKYRGETKEREQGEANQSISFLLKKMNNVCICSFYCYIMTFLCSKTKQTFIVQNGNWKTAYVTFSVFICCNRD